MGIKKKRFSKSVYFPKKVDTSRVNIFLFQMFIFWSNIITPKLNILKCNDMFAFKFHDSLHLTEKGDSGTIYCKRKYEYQLIL